MARFIVQAVHADGEPRRWTLRERIVTGNLASEHYAAQLIERLTWATADAEALESPPPDRAADERDDARHFRREISRPRALPRSKSS